MTRVRLAACLVALAGSTATVAQEPGSRTESVVTGEKFAAGGLHRFLFGNDYRDLWTMPVELPVLDLNTYAGGLKATRRLGHGQTKALALMGANGVAYTFRPILKDPIGLLPPELRETLAGDIVRDQMASQHPAGHVVVPVLLKAAGVLHNDPILVIMPDDPALGEFRDDFKGQAGDLEEFTGQKGWSGASEIIDGEEMWKRLRANAETRVDARAYLTARLVDHLIGDWDRHRDQWRWAKMAGRDGWLPIPEDRDQAFVRFEGFALTFLRPGLPLLVHYEPKYSSLDGLTFDSWDVDRKLLPGLEWPAWQELATTLRAQITDQVIQTAIDRMPQAWRAKDGPRLSAGLKSRRDGLVVHARRFYDYFARQVDVRATDQADRAEIERLEGGDVVVRLRTAEGAQPYFERRFDRKETSEVRLYLFGGDDRVTTRGARGGVTVRVVGGDGADVIDDSVGGLRVSDSSGGNDVRKGPGTAYDTKPYVAPPGNPRGDWIPPRDWGRRTILPITRLNGNSDLGLLINIGFNSTGYGFRKDPYADRQVFRAGYATKHQAFRGTYLGEFRRENSSRFWRLSARASGIDILRFYGFGNETGDDAPDEFFKVEQDQFVIAPSFVVPVGKRGELAVGPVVKWVVTENTEGRFIGLTRPYGSVDRFGGFGAQANFNLDTTDRPGLPVRGVRLNAGGSFSPAAWDVVDTFGEVHGDITTYLGAKSGLEPTLILRGGGKRVFGTYPFAESAFLGGGQSVRGLRSQRYAGDAALFGSAEFRVSLAHAFIFVPGEVGVFGLFDVGRVYLEGETSKKWHTGAGGGVFFTSPNRRNSFSVAIAQSEGRTGFYIKTGLAF